MMSKTAYKLNDFLASPDKYHSLSFYPNSKNNYYEFTDNDCQRLIDVLRSNMNVVSLRLENNLIGDAGATAIIQPGGSIKDEDVIKAADERGLAMVFTGMRHFKH